MSSIKTVELDVPHLQLSTYLTTWQKARNSVAVHPVNSVLCECLCAGGRVQGSWNNTPLKDKDVQHDGLDVWFDKAGEMDMFQWN